MPNPLSLLIAKSIVTLGLHETARLLELQVGPVQRLALGLVVRTGTIAAARANAHRLTAAVASS
jgi:hypothetical protein